MRWPRPQFTVRRLMVAVALVALAICLRDWMARRAEASRVAALNRAIARSQLAEIDEAWAYAIDLAQNSRIEINGGTFGPWGRRRLEAMRRAGAGKAEIVAALQRYIGDLEMLDAVIRSRCQHLRPTTEDHEINFLRMEAEIWLNEERGWVTSALVTRYMTPTPAKTPAPPPSPPPPPPPVPSESR